MNRETEKSLQRLLPRLEQYFNAKKYKGWSAFSKRLTENFDIYFESLRSLYGHRYDFFYYLESILLSAADMWAERSAALKKLDKQREKDPHWFLSNKIVGAVCYVDLFADNLTGIAERIPYFKDLGITYLHLMPLFECPTENNDGGYAVSNYRKVNPSLGCIQELERLAAELRGHGISLVLDFIYNHTSNEHEWAQRARRGEEEYQEYYLTFPDRELPDQYDQHLREIFPDDSPGNFTFDSQMGRWVWTTFNHYQWDINYQNPEVFQKMAEEMLFLANAGVEVLRLDAVVFAWKKLGTVCENLPQVHSIIEAYNALMRIAAPALIFKSEAIVHPDDVLSYIAPGKCQVSYNPTLMASIWDALATRDTQLLQRSMQHRFAIDSSCAWVNYVRCHDDIGWSFADDDAMALGINPYDHRQFLNAFYTGKFDGSFARGKPFQYNPKNGDCRIVGTCASLAGLEKALTEEGDTEVDLAIKRILMIHAVILAVGGIPLLYLGDELGTLNDYSYRGDDAKANDSRWLHRPRMDWSVADKRHQSGSVQQQVFEGLQRLIGLRKESPALSNVDTRFFDTGNAHLFAFSRCGEGEHLLIVANFSEQHQRLDMGRMLEMADTGKLVDQMTGQVFDDREPIDLAPYQVLWLQG